MSRDITVPDATKMGGFIYFITFWTAPTPKAANTTKITARIRKRPNRILAMAAAPAAIPPKTEGASAQ